MRISVVIVNYNGATLLPDCLDGLEAQTRPADEVIIVDNASTDDSVPLLRQRYPWTRIIESDTNLGFSEGNNLGIRASSGSIVVLLNNDTTPSPGFVEEITGPLERDDQLSAVSGVMLFSEHVNTVATSGIKVFSNGLALDSDIGARWRDLPAEGGVFGPTGGAAAFRRSALDDVELFPEPFFLYLEDVDLAWRLRLRGHRSVSRSAAWALHIYSASSVEGSTLKDYYLARNRAWTLIRCWPDTLWRRFWPVILRYEFGALAFALLTGRWASLRGRMAGWAGVRRLCRVRARIQRSVTADEQELLYWIHSAPSVRNVLRVRSVIRSMIESSDPGRTPDRGANG